MVDPAEDPTRNNGLNGHPSGSIASMIATLAQSHGITADRHPIDDFADAVSRLSDAEVILDPIERLLANLQRAGVLNSREGFALHVAYLRESGPSTIAR